MLRLRRATKAHAKIEAAKKAAAQARKEKIKALEAQRLAHVPKTSLEIEEEMERQRRRELAERMREESTDEAKLMNQLRNYAITVSIRDRQLEEKKQREEAAKLAEKMRDAETELARLEELKRVHEKESNLRAATREAAKGVYKQVEDRINVKQNALMAMRKEGEEMVAAMKVQEQEYRRHKEEQHRKKLAGLADILASNEEALRIKEEKKAKERAEEERIEAVQREMEAKKEAQAAEAARLQKEREEALFKVRGETQKAMDTRAAIDELRARRAFEAGQREARQKEAEKARKQAAAIEELKRERIAQLATKQSRLAVEVEADKAEFERARKIQEEWIAQEEEAARIKDLHNKEHLRALQRQKEEKELEAKQRVLNERASGAVARAEEEAKQAMLKSIRERKVKELLELGVSSKYTVQLARFEPVKKTLI
jgi:Trichohyalin-plectin-homology domain